MNIYVESNFVLELVFEQEHCRECELLLELSEQGKCRLVIPAYCLAEPHEKLFRQAKSRRELQQSLETELRQLARTGAYTARITSIRDIASLFVQSIEQERQRFNAFRDRLLTSADIIPLTAEVLREASILEVPYDLTAQDALVFGSVLTHLRLGIRQVSCFLNRNSRDFDNPTLVQELERHGCKMIPRFDHGYNFVNARV